ncbi:MAG: hypothetical protein ABIC19_01110 [Patescibacteria group bacterium]|nr:hypothetical protein [Patescibacteria group bacterium]
MNKKQTKNKQKEIDYWRIIKKAFNITLKNRFLWVFGILTALTSGGGGGGNFGGGGGLEEDKLKEMASQGEWMDFWNKLGDFFHQHLVLILVAAGLLLLVFLALKVLGIISEAALVLAVNKIDNRLSVNFSSAFKLGFKKFWPVVFIKIITALIALVSLFVISSPIIFFFVTRAFWIAVPMLILGIFLFVFIAIFLGVVCRLAILLAVLSNHSVLSAYGEAYLLMSKKIGKVILMYLINLAASMIGGIATVTIIMGLLIIGALLGLLSFFTFNIPGAVGTGILFLLVIIAGAVFIKGIRLVFEYSMWVLFFKEINGEKIQERQKEKSRLKKIAAKAPVNQQLVKSSKISPLEREK